MKNYLNAFNNLLIVNMDSNQKWAIIKASNMVVRTIVEEKKYTIQRWEVKNGDTLYAVAVDQDELFFIP